jgi:hypothetical protein
MTRKLTVEISDEVAAGVQAEAERRGIDAEGVISDALVEHLGWQAVARIRERNADLDEEAALSAPTRSWGLSGPNAGRLDGPGCHRRLIRAWAGDEWVCVTSSRTLTVEVCLVGELDDLFGH